MRFKIGNFITLTIFSRLALLHAQSAENMFDLSFVFDALTNNFYDVAGDSSNNIHVVWVDGIPSQRRIIYTSRQEAVGGWQSSELVSFDSGLSSNPQVAVDSRRFVHTLYERRLLAGNWGEVVYRKRDTLVTWSPAVRFADIHRPQLLSGKDDTLFSIWSGGRGELVFCLRKSGSPLEGPCPRPFDQPVLNIDAQGCSVALWADSNTAKLWLSVFNADTGWENVEATADSAKPLDMVVR